MKKYLCIILFLLAINTLSPLEAQEENYRYKLTQSSEAYTLWTSLPGDKVFKDTPVPDEEGDEIKVYCAKNEFEPFVLAIQPQSTGSITINMGDFGNGITSEIFQVKYVNITQTTDQLGETGDNPDPLWPIENNVSITVESGQNTAIWISLYVPSTTAAGVYSANITVGSISIPVNLKVFNFTLPEEPSVKSQMRVSYQSILTKYGVSGIGSEYWMYVNNISQWFIDHRLTPQNPLWPGSLTLSGGAPYIDYNCSGSLSDPNGIWGFEEPALRYLNGSGNMNDTYTESFNNGKGFSSYMALNYNNNDASADQRPSTFCEKTRSSSDWYTADNPGTAYNISWFNYIKAIQDYLSELGYLDKSYYHIANKPVDQSDYDAVAWYSQELKNAAPGLKLMVTMEPDPEIYNHATYTDAKIDIWLAALNNFNPEVSADREINYNEETWTYFLQWTTLPYMNPITIDHPGADAKLTGWFLWKYRIRGLSYYSMNNWSTNPWESPLSDNQNGNLSMFYPPSMSNSNIMYGENMHRFVPSIRLELLRDGLEDYEYFRLLNGNTDPVAGTSNEADDQVDKIINGLTAYCNNSNFSYNIRRLIGLKIGGEIASIPDFIPSGSHPRTESEPGNYYINFQDPDGEPLTTFTNSEGNYYTFEGKDYLQAGPEAYDSSKGYGWFAPNDINWATHYLSHFTNGNELQKSVIYSDYGRRATFEFDLPSGDYNVTAGIGHSAAYSEQYITIEGIPFFSAATTDNSVLTTTKLVSVKDNRLSLEMGSPSNDEFTMLNFLDIEVNNDTTGIEENESRIPIQILPNPFNDHLEINLSLDSSQKIDIDIVDIYGRTAGKVYSGSLLRGEHSIKWAAETLPSGVYFCRISIGNYGKQVFKCIKK